MLLPGFHVIERRDLNPFSLPQTRCWRRCEARCPRTRLQNSIAWPRWRTARCTAQRVRLRWRTWLWAASTRWPRAARLQPSLPRCRTRLRLRCCRAHPCWARRALHLLSPTMQWNLRFAMRLQASADVHCNRPCDPHSIECFHHGDLHRATPLLLHMSHGHMTSDPPVRASPS